MFVCMRCVRSSWNNSALSFPRMPASVVTTYSHLAAALFFRGTTRGGMKEPVRLRLLISLFLQVGPRTMLGTENVAFKKGVGELTTAGDLSNLATECDVCVHLEVSP